MRAGSWWSLQSLIRHARACPGHPRSKFQTRRRTWMAGTSPAMTASLYSHQHPCSRAGRNIRHHPFAKQIEIDVAAGQYQTDALALDLAFLLQGGGERRGARAFRQIM